MIGLRVICVLAAVIVFAIAAIYAFAVAGAAVLTVLGLIAVGMALMAVAALPWPP